MFSAINTLADVALRSGLPTSPANLVFYLSDLTVYTGVELKTKRMVYTCHPTNKFVDLELQSILDGAKVRIWHGVISAKTSGNAKLFTAVWKTGSKVYTCGVEPECYVVIAGCVGRIATMRQDAPTISDRYFLAAREKDVECDRRAYLIPVGNVERIEPGRLMPPWTQALLEYFQAVAAGRKKASLFWLCLSATLAFICDQTLCDLP